MASTALDAFELDDWATTPLGAPSGWSDALRTAAQLCLAYPSTCCVLWGEQSRFFYNASLARSIGPRHPSAMGQPLYDVLPNLWRTIGPLVHEVMRTGRPFSATRFLVDGAPGGSRGSRPLWEHAWLTALPEPVEGVLVFGLDARFANNNDPQGRMRRLAAAAAERLGR